MNFSDPVIIAALIGATTTVLTALIQLRISWRQELKERERGQPITKKTRRGPVIAVVVLMLAAAIGGFALSQYFLMLLGDDQDRLHAELKSGLTEISRSAARLEQARLADREQIEAAARRAEALRLAEEGAVASVLVGPCRKEGVPPAGAKPECGEQNAVRIAVCVRLPAAAVVREVLLYTRYEDAQQPWTDARVQPGQDAGYARFADKHFERPDGDGVKQVCGSFVNWSSEKARLARIQVKYAP